VSQTNIAKNNPIMGDKLYTNLLARKGTKFCLDKSLKASKRGWTSPIKETLFGPVRKWNKPITFRSKRVKNATERSKSKQ
jgi:hypothetical protein